ncbi:hypothetical protein ACVWXL_008718 [Bradyrhizobium sp. GM22.5]
MGIAQRAQIFLDLAVHRLGRIQEADRGRAVGAQIVHRLEQIGGRVGDLRDAVGGLQAIPGLVGGERERDHHADRRDRDHRLQQRGYGQTIQHRSPPIPNTKFVKAPRQQQKKGPVRQGNRMPFAAQGPNGFRI